MKVNNKLTKVNGTTLGLHITSQINLIVDETVSIGVLMGLLGGTLKRITENDFYEYPLREHAGLGRFELMLNIRLSL